MFKTDDMLPVLGTMEVKVNHNISTRSIPGKGPSLLGRYLLESFKLNLKAVYTVSVDSKLEDLLAKYA